MRHKSRFQARGGKRYKPRISTRGRLTQHFSHITIYRLRMAAKRRASGVKARAAIIMRQRRAVASALRRGNRKVS